VRGYGLVDSPMVKSARGKTLDLKALAASGRAADAAYLSGAISAFDGEGACGSS